jgi:hypothetical protein
MIKGESSRSNQKHRYLDRAHGSSGAETFIDFATDLSRIRGDVQGTGKKRCGRAIARDPV